MTAPVWTTPAGFLGTLTERKTTATNLVATGTSLTYSVVSGKLPTGLYLNTSTGLILGTPVSVTVDTSSTFVVRAANADGVRDRTFSYNVTGTDAPVWATNSGRLPVGMNGEYYTFNKEYVDYQLHADTDILTSGNTLKYYISDNQGQLPPGLKLSSSGRITGYIDDYLSIDVEASTRGGYDTEIYDFYPYDHGVINQNLTTSTYFVEKYNVSLVTAESPAKIVTSKTHDIFDRNQVIITDVGADDPINSVHQINNTSTYNIEQSTYYSTSTSIFTTSSYYYAKSVNNTTIELYRDVNLTIPVDLSTSTETYSTGTGIVLWGSQSFINPKSVNKVYQFYVTVTDGIASSQRLFSIEVADPDTFRADNTLISVDTNSYDADVGYLLAPIWQSKYGIKLPQTANLGAVRAGKPQVFSLYDYDPYPLQGPSYYEWNTVKVNPDIKLYADSQVNSAFLPTKNLITQNSIYFKDAEIIPVKGMKIQLSESIPSVDATVYTIVSVIKTSETSGILNLDQPLSQTIPDSRLFYAGTESKHPPGINLDPENGTLYGQIPYQPSYSNGYRFTVKLVKIDQESEGGSTILDAIGTTDARIVGKVFYEVTTGTYDLKPYELPLQPSSISAGNRLPTALEYNGSIGDILLVSIPQYVENDSFLPLMDGTTYAYVYNPIEYIFKQVTGNVTGTELTLVNSGITPQEGWAIRQGNLSTTIVSVINSGTSVTLELASTIPAKTNTLTSTWTLIDPSLQCWTYLGETVASNQIYLLNVLGEIPSTIKFISSSSLGTLSTNEISEIYVKAENTNTNYAIQYEIVQGELPPGLTLNLDGSISGKITTTGQTYFDLVQTTSTFIGSIENNILTVNTITSGEIVLHQNITHSTSTSPIFIIKDLGNSWKVSDHTLSTSILNTSTVEIIENPINVLTTSFNGSTLLPNYQSNTNLFDGGLTTIDRNWYFTIRASDVYRLSAIEKEFYISVFKDTVVDYTRIYVKPFLSAKQRMAYKDFVTNPVIFDPVLIYRPNDPEFGIQQQIRLMIETGIEKTSLNNYALAMQNYFYRKKFYFGEVKSIKAKDNNGNNVYEIIYVDIIDDQMSGNNSPSYSVSVNNMQKSLEEITLDSNNTISVNERLQPRFMTTLDPDTGVPLGFIKAVPICYTIPGGSTKILSRLANALKTGLWDFKQINFDTDRIIIETTQETGGTSWLLYPTDRR